MRPPATAAVSITQIPGGDGCTLVDALRVAKDSIRLEEIGVTAIMPKRAITGGLLFEIGGENSSAKADVPAERMKEALHGKSVKVGRPTKTSEVRLSSLENAATIAVVRRGISAFGAEREEEVKIGEIRRAPNGLGTVWVRCPMDGGGKVHRGGLGACKG